MTKRKREVWLVGTDDGWDGLFIDGVSAYQDHRISIRDFMAALHEAGLAKDVDFRIGYVTGEANRKIEDLGRFPDLLKDVDGVTE